MAKTTIAEFAADLEVRIKNLKGLNDFSDKLNQLPKKFKKVTESVTSSQKNLGGAVGEATKNIGKQRSELEKSTKAFWDNAEAQKNLAAVAAKAKKISNKWNSKQIVRARTQNQASDLGGMLGNQTGFKRLAVVEQYAKKIADSKLSNVISDLDKKSKEDSLLKQQRDAIDKLHGKALREDAARNKANQTRLDRELDAFNKLHGKALKEDASRTKSIQARLDRELDAFNKLHGKALRENAKFDARKVAAAERLAKIEQNAIESAAALRERLQNKFARLIRSDLSAEQRQVERIARIRAEGAKAGISQHRIEAAVARSNANFEARQSSGSTRGTGGSGRGFSVMGGATVGGAIGSATSSLSGILPGIGGGWALVNVNRKSQEIMAAENSIRALAPTLDEANKILGSIQKLGSEMGGSYSDMTKQFASVYASTRSNIGSGATVDMFRGILKYGNVLGMDDEAMKGSLRAVSQMFSKDRITAEEARSQLAERMPAAMQMLADVVSGGDTKKLDKMMSSGELDPKIIMPLFGKLAEDISEQNDAYAKSLKTSITAQRRMNFEWEMFIKLFSEAGGEQGFARIFNAIAKFLKDNPTLAKGMADALSKVATGIEWTLQGLTNLIEAFTKVANSMGLTGTELALITTGLLMVMTPFGKVLAIAYALFLVLEDLYVSLNGGDGAFKRFYDSLSSENQQKLIDLGESLGKLTDAFKELFAAFSELEIQPLKPVFESAFGGVAELIQSHIDRLTTLVRLMAKITEGDWSGAADIAAASVQQRLVGMGQTVLSVLPDDLMGGDMSTGVYSSGMNRQDYLFNKGYQSYTKATDSPITFGNVNVTLNVENADPSVMGYDAANIVAEAFMTQLKVTSKDFNTGKRK